MEESYLESVIHGIKFKRSKKLQHESYPVIHVLYSTCTPSHRQPHFFCILSKIVGIKHLNDGLGIGENTP